ncbi:MAG: agmatinase [Phycisphaerales bacterium]
MPTPAPDYPETGFADLPAEFRDATRAAASILPVPYDATSTWKKGADRGPAALLQASVELELYDLPTRSEPYRRGIATRPPVRHDGDPESLATIVHRETAAALERNQIPITLGGEHSVSIGAIQAAAEHSRDLTVLQIDAHGDTRESYHGSTHNHACVMARAREVASIIQVGLRAVDVVETETMDPSRVFFAHDIADRPDDEWIPRVVDRLTDEVYVTIDLDAFDPSLLPATGTPEPGGLQWWPVNRLLRAVCRRSRVVGFDVVELLPSPGQHASEFIAAKLVYRFLAEIFAQSGGDRAA